MQMPINTRCKIAATDQYIAFCISSKSEASHDLFVNKLLKTYLTTEKRVRSK